MKTIASLIIILIFAGNLAAQEIWKDTILLNSYDKIIEPELKNFSQLKIDTLLIFTEYCSGCVYPSSEEKCNSPTLSHTYYFLWKKNNEIFFTVRDDCFEYATLRVDSNLFEYFYSVKDSLTNDSLKNPKYWIDHAGFCKLIVIDKQHKFSLLYDGSYFNNPESDPGAAYNNTTLRKTFRDNLIGYFKNDLSTYIIPSRQRKNSR